MRSERRKEIVTASSGSMVAAWEHSLVLGAGQCVICLVLEILSLLLRLIIAPVAAEDTREEALGLLLLLHSLQKSSLMSGQRT